MDRIFLIGYRGTGKTTVARLLAEALHWQWIDADDYLEQRHARSVRQIFAEEGELGFRDKEQAVLAELSLLRQHVIATGGGVVLRAENRERLKSGFVVWLRADPAVLFERMQQDKTSAERRPALSTGGLVEVEELLKVREPFYTECADLTLDCTHLSPEAIVGSILDNLPASRS